MNSNIHLHTLQQLPPIARTKSAKAGLTKEQSFKQLLQEKLIEKQPLAISKHAMQRMNARGISFSEEKWEQIEEKVQEAKEKGVTDSLVITKDATLVVSAKNDTVITVLNRDEAKTQIFTNINGTIILD